MALEDEVMASLFDAIADSRCARCNRIMHPASSKLVEAYYTILCNSCLNDWEVYLRDKEVWIDLQTHQDRLGMIICQSTYDGEDRTVEMSRVRQDIAVCRRRLFELAETWVALGPPPPRTEG